MSKNTNYAIWYLQQRAADQLVASVRACSAAQLDDSEIITMVYGILDKPEAGTK